MAKKVSQTKKDGKLLPVLLILVITFSAVSSWYATDPIWPLITLLFSAFSFVALRKGW